MLNEGSQGKLKKLGIFWPHVKEEASDLLMAAEENKLLTIHL